MAVPLAWIQQETPSPSAMAQHSGSRGCTYSWVDCRLLTFEGRTDESPGDAMASLQAMWNSAVRVLPNSG